MEITCDLLKQLLHYDPETGIFTRIAALTPRAQRHVGKRAGTPNKSSGYLEMHAGGRLCLAHRLAWIYCHGAIPNGMRVDHENGLVTDNRIDNLRMATVAQNGQNCKTRIDNTRGIKGVSFDKARDKWAVSVGKKRIGRFDTLFDAACVRKSAAIRTFGEFARES